MANTNELRFQRQLLGFSAIGVLSALMKLEKIPAPHDANVRTLLAEYEALTKQITEARSESRHLPSAQPITNNEAIYGLDYF